MLKKPLAIAAIATAAAVTVIPMQARAGGDPGLGALLGASVGAAIGHQAGGRDGAIVGGVLGAITGASIAAGSRGYYEPSYVAPPVALYAPAPVYYEPPPVYYAPRPVPAYFRAPHRPVYVPVVVDRRHQGRHEWRDERGHPDRDGWDPRGR